MPEDKSNVLTASATKWWKLLFSASNKSNCWDLTPPSEVAHSSDPNGGRSVGRDQCSEQPLLKAWTNSGVYCERCGKIVFEQSIQPLWPSKYTPLSLIATLQPVYLAYVTITS